MNPTLEKHKERKSSDGWLIAAPFAALLLTIANAILSWKVDFLIAEASSAITALGSGWTEFSTREWMFGSLLGPAMALHPILFLLLLVVSGCAAAWLLIHSAREGRICRSRLAWMIFVLLWIVRVPMPGEWTIYYFTAVAY